MKAKTAKTARRFLSRNRTKMTKHKLSLEYQSPSFFRMWEKCIAVLVKGW